MEINSKNVLVLRPTRVIVASAATRDKLLAFSKSLKGKELFSASNNKAEIILGKPIVYGLDSGKINKTKSQ